MTAVEWLVANLFVYGMPDQRCIELVKKAKEMEKQQIEISDEKILQAGKDFFSQVIGATQNDVSAWISASEWYREQLKKKQ